MILTVHSRLRNSQPRLLISIAIVVLSLLMTLGYALFGHSLIKALYESDSSVANRLMSGRQQTSLLAYSARADQAALKVSIIFVSIALAILASRNPFGVALSAMSVLVTSLLFFLLLDTFPPLASALHLGSIPYFSFRAHHLPDPELGFLDKPLQHTEDHNFRGAQYSTAYGIDMPPETVIFDTDEEGFRNQPGVALADVVILGSSFPEYGYDLEDTYTKKLEKHLKGPLVASVAKGAYGPIEFLKAFQRFGLRKKPKYAILTFNTEDLRYLDADVAEGAANKRIENLKIVYHGNFWRRWRLALEQVGEAGWTFLSKGFSSMVRSDASPRGVHPDLAILKLPGNPPQPMIFPSHHTGLASEDFLNLSAWRQFEQVLIDFKNISAQNEVVPVLAYIPFATEAYSEYTTLESGENWLAKREKGIATSGNDEKAVQALAERVGIEMISFLPAFKDAARQGKLVYYRFDNHWNSEGREIAARVTADALRAHIDGAASSSKGPTTGVVQPVHYLQK
jgi:acetyltransferase AlgX (SGNH hydrolase-like protein)